MNELQKEIITKLVYIFSQKANNANSQEIIDSLCSMNISDAIDNILVSLSDLLSKKLITKEDVFLNANDILKLSPEKYTTVDDLIDRLNWIKAMNIEHAEMPLTVNHQLVINAFDEFNVLLQGKFDCYYTGGIMGYLATDRPLERYHGDLDLFINEQQLIALKELVDCSSNFEFVSNMGDKELKDHEYKITYKGTPMSIGLFLFERQPDNSITTKNYYFENQNGNHQLLVDEHHFSKSYTEMSFSDSERKHNDIPFKMMSLESIYNSKKNSRPKDRYDASIIKDKVDMLVDYKLDTERKNNFDVNRKEISQSIIHTIEQMMEHTLESNSVKAK